MLGTQTEIEGFTYPVQLRTNQKCRLPFSCTASGFLIGLFEFSLQRAECIFPICSNISLFLHLPLRKRVLSTLTGTWRTETSKILLRAILTSNQYLQVLLACSHSTTVPDPCLKFLFTGWTTGWINSRLASFIGNKSGGCWAVHGHD